MPIPEDNNSIRKVIEELTMSEPFKSGIEKSLNKVKESLDKLEVSIGLIKCQEPSYGMSAIENIKIPACIPLGLVCPGAVKEAMAAEERRVRERIYSGHDDTGSIIFISSGSGERPFVNSSDEWILPDQGVTWDSGYPDGNKANVYIDGVLVGTQQRDGNNIKVTIPKEYISKEGPHIVEVEHVPIHEPIDSINNGIELEGTLKGRRYTDAFRRVVNRSGRKSEDKKEEKLPRKLRRGW